MSAGSGQPPPVVGIAQIRRSACSAGRLCRVRLPLPGGGEARGSSRRSCAPRPEQKAARTRSWLLTPSWRALADRASVSALIDRCCFDRRSGVVDSAALARIAARAGSDSRLQPVKHVPHGSGATLSLAFRSSSVSPARWSRRNFCFTPIRVTPACWPLRTKRMHVSLWEVTAGLSERGQWLIGCQPPEILRTRSRRRDCRIRRRAGEAGPGSGCCARP
jgi:hypothetical protein